MIPTLPHNKSSVMGEFLPYPCTGAEFIAKNQKSQSSSEKAKQLPDQNLDVMPSTHSLSPCPRKKTYHTFKYLLTHMEEAD